MIKRFRFFDSAGEASSYAGADLPVGSGFRPVRITIAYALDEVLADQRHQAVVIEWFDKTPPYDPFIDSGDFEGDEEVKRGADWMEKRWADGGEKIKHMAIAKRATHLSPTEFSELWRSRAGTVKSSSDGPAVIIPEAAKGLAYVQNHELPPPAEDWLYDAVNEVYFDDVDSLRYRIDWFQENMGDQGEGDLVSEASFLAVREEVVYRA